MIKETLLKYKEEILAHYSEAMVISKTLNSDKIANHQFSLAIVAMCIKYEALTSDLMEEIYHADPRYNHPWANTRQIAKKFNIDISNEYRKAHDAWDIYNTIKHINHETQLEKKKLFNKYAIQNMQEAAEYVKKSIINMIDRLAEIKEG